jgi:hypothetical protein
MVEKLQEILAEIKRDKGPVTVFAIIKMDEITDKWSLIFSAPWVTDTNKTETFNYLRNLVIAKLTLDEVASIARLSIFTTGEHLVQLLLKTFKVEGGNIVLKDSTLNGYKIHEANVLESVSI